MLTVTRISGPLTAFFLSASLLGAAPSFQGMTQDSGGPSGLSENTSSPAAPAAGSQKIWNDFLSGFHPETSFGADLTINAGAFDAGLEAGYLKHYDLQPTDGTLSEIELQTARAETDRLRQDPARWIAIFVDKNMDGELDQSERRSAAKDLLQRYGDGKNPLTARDMERSAAQGKPFPKWLARLVEHHGGSLDQAALMASSQQIHMERFDTSPQDGILSAAEKAAAAKVMLQMRFNPAVWITTFVDANHDGRLSASEKQAAFQALKQLANEGNQATLSGAKLYTSMSRQMAGERPRAKVSYASQVKPILERNCIACHACYDAPCQLKMTSDEGLDRGASQEKVYDAARLEHMVPTRIFFDATSTEGWRKKNFYSVTTPGSKDKLSSLLARMLDLGRKRSLKANQPIPEQIKLGLSHDEKCPKLAEFEAYAKERPEEGMPFAVTGLRGEEYQTLKDWMVQGAKIDEPKIVVPSAHQRLITDWEVYLNGGSKKEQLVARYVYEHIFLSHLYFDGPGSRKFYELVRSSTAPGQPISPIEARSEVDRPNSDPGGTFFYRIRPLESTVVHKTHIIYPFGAKKLARVQQLFGGNWTVDELPAYDDEAAINPFRTFHAIPAEARYRYLLDNSLHFVRTFIRGPVCRGTTATDVIQDHFFAFFLAPEADVFLHDQKYADKQLKNLGISALDAKNGRHGVTWPIRAYRAYAKGRVKAYEGKVATWDSLWDGEGVNHDALLTVFRHEDSATVYRGLLGRPPKTAWVIDFPLLERIYYQLVANFDVFGHLQHQASTRLSFDRMRAEGENIFLRYFPKELRSDLRASWYKGYLSGAKKRRLYIKPDTETPTELKYESQEITSLMPQFVEMILKKMAPVAGSEDRLNRCASVPCLNPQEGEARHLVETNLEKISLLRAKDAPVINLLPEITFLRFAAGGSPKDFAYTLTHDRSLKNAAFMAKSSGWETFGTTGGFEPELDYLTVARGPLGSYPNFIFYIPEGQAKDFVDTLLGVRDQDGFNQLVERYGIRRMHPDLWDHFHFFADYMKRTEPEEAGVYDMNRYANF
jgi:hypothetical protein